jgi:hypothetical protein
MQGALSPEKPLPLIINDYLASNRSKGDMFDEITMGALATIGTKGIIENFLDGRIKEIKRDGLSKLEKLIAPDKDYKKRYTKGILDLLNNYAKPKRVLIIVSHHKGIPCLLKLKYFG